MQLCLSMFYIHKPNLECQPVFLTSHIATQGKSYVLHQTTRTYTSPCPGGNFCRQFGGNTRQNRLLEAQITQIFLWLKVIELLSNLCDIFMDSCNFFREFACNLRRVTWAYDSCRRICFCTLIKSISFLSPSIQDTFLSRFSGGGGGILDGAFINCFILISTTCGKKVLLIFIIRGIFQR